MRYLNKSIRKGLLEVLCVIVNTGGANDATFERFNWVLNILDMLWTIVAFWVVVATEFIEVFCIVATKGFIVVFKIVKGFIGVFRVDKNKFDITGAIVGSMLVIFGGWTAGVLIVVIWTGEEDALDWFKDRAIVDSDTFDIGAFVAFKKTVANMFKICP